MISPMLEAELATVMFGSILCPGALSNVCVDPTLRDWTMIHGPLGTPKIAIEQWSKPKMSFHVTGGSIAIVSR